MKEEHNFIQWKATDLFMEFSCECGHQNSYGGYCVYRVKCKGCGEVYELDHKVKMQKVGKDYKGNVTESYD
jgi:hypothetical protein